MTHRYASFFALSLMSLVLVGLCTSHSDAQWVNGQNAEYVIGQSNFTSSDTGHSSTRLGYQGTHGFAIDYAHGKLYLPDHINFRVLRFAYPITGNSPAAELVFGQADLNSQIPPNSATASTLNRPWGVAVYNGDLWVADRADGRILRYPSAWSDASNGPAADRVLGAPDFTTVNYGTSQTQLLQPRGICFDGQGNLWVADGNNNRVLEFANASSKSNGAAADKVLGQPNFTSAALPVPPTSSSMNTPVGVCFEGTTLWVGDGDNSRALRFNNAASKANGADADGVLGQPDFVSGSGNPNPTAATLFTATGVAVDGNGALYVCDYADNRVLIYRNAATKANGSNADNVLGQADFAGSNAGTTQATMSRPNGIEIDNAHGKLLVADEGNARALQFSASAPLPIQLSSFAASASRDGVRLTWVTMSEVNNYGFEIQRSPVAPAGEWVKVGFVAGIGTSASLHSYSFTDTMAGVAGVYRLKQIDLSGAFHYSDPVSVASAARASDQEPIPAVFALTQNYPNPFNPTTQIEYDLPKAGEVSLVVYDILGREVATLSSGYHEAGRYTARWDAGRDASGVYFARVRVSGTGVAGAFTKDVKMLLAK